MATTCVKDSSYPSMLKRHSSSRAHSIGGVRAARGYRCSGICLLHTPENAIYELSVMHFSTSRPQDVL